MITRRGFIESVSTGATLLGAAVFMPRGINAKTSQFTPTVSPMLPDGTRAETILESLPGKRPLLKLSYRPPNYETPLEYFRSAITPNDAFFVRYHLSNIPEVDAKTWKLTAGGDGARAQIELWLDDLKGMPNIEVVAVNQCSGNRRGLFQPHVPGVQWGYGAMGCARWKGVRLKDVLDKIGLNKDAIEVAFDGADEPNVDKTPDFIKSIPLWKAMEETTLIAYEMNGQPLPRFNGFPVRLVVPGWTGTYWVKHLTSIKILMKPESGFWMNPAYRIPLGKFPVASRFTSQETATSTPITEILVSSLITSHADGTRLSSGTSITLGGIAWDGGYGIRSVEISSDEGRTWHSALLGEDLGPFAFRTFRFPFLAKSKGAQSIDARATNRIGQTQTAETIPNPSGYHNNVMHRITFNIE